MKKTLTLATRLTLIFLCCFTTSIAAKNYFINSLSGSNSNIGLSETAPRQTIQSAETAKFTISQMAVLNRINHHVNSR